MRSMHRMSFAALALMLGFACTAYAGTSPQTMIYKANQALEQNPKDGKAYYNRGTALLELEQYDKAVSDLTQAISLEPKAADAYFNRGMAYRYQKKNTRPSLTFQRRSSSFRRNGSITLNGATRGS